MTKLKVEIADSPYLLSKGLMYRQKLATDSGMLFKFPTLLEARFWGKNTYIPLDVAFLDQSDRITAIKHIVPLSTKGVYSDGPCDKAIEANAGFFEENNIKPGDKAIISDNEIVFEIND